MAAAATGKQVGKVQMSSKSRCRSLVQTASKQRRCRLGPAGLLTAAAVAVLSLSPLQLFAVSPGSGRSRRHGNRAALTGRTSWQQAEGKRQPVTGASASLSLPWNNAQTSQDKELSNRDWIRLYRTLGLADDATRDQVQRAAARLRRKYSEDEEALERVERANLLCMQRIVSKKEEVLKKKQQANRLREFGDTPRRLVVKGMQKYLPAGVNRMMEFPDAKHFQRASVLLGAFTLLGLCVPTQASNFVGLSAASALGLIYARGRPEPVKDEMGAPGQVQKLNFKEVIATIAVVATAGLIGGGATLGLARLRSDTSLPVTFLVSCCFMFWTAALFFKVYGCFEEEY
eukprot:TRINITY_DN36299_c1_g3_i1.p1 TRINITY_DN36299_c1_g3~~TRINITY_DN36299_c1_g3_i1.p1  ORF type:complete len:366 (+),score=94.93 TRINITY_DN36299_c1_g3_i1:68-1099(+)